MIRECAESDFTTMIEIINDAAQAYRGSHTGRLFGTSRICHLKKLRHEIEDGIAFWGLEHEGQLMGVMGIQDKGDCMLIRHAYIRTQDQKIRYRNKDCSNIWRT